MNDKRLPEQSNAGCVVCGTISVPVAVGGFDRLRRITSDCRPFGIGGYLSVCMDCGAVQKRVDARWLAEIGEIYQNYSTYYQSGGDEQIVFDRYSGQPRRRSDVLVDRLKGCTSWSQNIDVLDVGCGNGATLRAMSKVFPRWRLHGFELGDDAMVGLKTIAGFQQLYSGSLVEIQQSFNLVSMIHAIEHFESPLEVLRDLQPIVKDGQLFIEVCNVNENPFDILVADHLVHFSPHTLTLLLRRAGFEVRKIATDWVAKEISLLAQQQSSQVDGVSMQAPADESPAMVYSRISNYVVWLTNLVDGARSAMNAEKSFGLFGTSIAATWLADQLDGQLSFFVDEDTSRVGRQHMGLPILSPTEVPANSTVFFALAPAIAQAIAARLTIPGVKWVLPPS